MKWQEAVEVTGMAIRTTSRPNIVSVKTKKEQWIVTYTKGKNNKTVNYDIRVRRSNQAHRFTNWVPLYHEHPVAQKITSTVLTIDPGILIVDIIKPKTGLLIQYREALAKKSELCKVANNIDESDLSSDSTYQELVKLSKIVTELLEVL